MSDYLHLIETVFKIIGGATALVLFIIGFIRYRKDQLWKRKEFVSKEVKEFLNDPAVKNCLSMMDWSDREYELYPKQPDYSKRFVRVTHDSLAYALLPHGAERNHFSPDEAVIRDHFDQFLGHLGRFEHFIQSGLLQAEDLETYLDYWFRKMGKSLPALPRNSLHHFILFYGYDSVVSLLARFGQQIKPDMEIGKIILQLPEDVKVRSKPEPPGEQK